MGVACYATILLSVGMGWSGRGNRGQPPQRGLGRGRESVARASTLGPDGGILKIPIEELI